MRTVATFRSVAFNVLEPRDYFINPCCFGDDLAKWIMKRFRARGVETDEEPGQEDFGWYFEFETQEGEHCCVMAYRPGDSDADGDWVLWVERSAGLIGSLLGRRKRVSGAAVQSVHEVLSSASEINGLRWHEKQHFDRGDEVQGKPTPVV